MIGGGNVKRNQYRCKTAMCPFYKKEDRQIIYCGGVADNSSIHLAFGFASSCNDYKTHRCRDDYQGCHIYRMLEDIHYGE